MAEIHGYIVKLLAMVVQNMGEINGHECTNVYFGWDGIGQTGCQPRMTINENLIIYARKNSSHARA